VAPVFFPLDDELELLPGEWPRAWLGWARACRSSKRVPNWRSHWGVEVDETTVRRHTQAAAAACVAERAAELERLERERPPAPSGPVVQYLSADGAMVPLVGGEWAEVKTLALGEAEGGRGADDVPEVHTSQLSYFSRLARRRGGDYAETAAAPGCRG